MDRNTCQSNSNQCPYWSKNHSHECRMSKGGLYIPMPEHVEMFCSTSQYIQCHQYIRGCELLKETAKKYGFIVDGGRRKFRRVAESVPLAIIACDADRKPVQLIDDNAMTVDMSLGGMRLLSHSEIPKDTLVAFEFGMDFTTPDLTGVGLVKWCERQDGSDKFEAGISFSDFRLTQAIGSHLGLPLM